MSSNPTRFLRDFSQGEESEPTNRFSDIPSDQEAETSRRRASDPSRPTSSTLSGNSSQTQRRVQSEIPPQANTPYFNTSIPLGGGTLPPNFGISASTSLPAHSHSHTQTDILPSALPTLHQTNILPTISVPTNYPNNSEASPITQQYFSAPVLPAPQFPLNQHQNPTASAPNPEAFQSRVRSQQQRSFQNRAQHNFPAPAANRNEFQHRDSHDSDSSSGSSSSDGSDEEEGDEERQGDRRQEGDDRNLLQQRIANLEQEVARARRQKGGIVRNGGPHILVDHSNIRKNFYFRGYNVRRFLQNLESYYRPQGVPDSEICDLIPLNMDHDIQKKVRSMEGFVFKDWKLLKSEMKEAFPDERDRHTMKELDEFCYKVKHRKGGIRTLSQLDKYGREFSTISDDLIRSDKLSWQEESRAFLRLFPSNIRQELEERRKMMRIVGEKAWLESDDLDTARRRRKRDRAWTLLKVSAIKKHARYVLEDVEAEYDERRIRKGRNAIRTDDEESAEESSESSESSESESDKENRSVRKRGGSKDKHRNYQAQDRHDKVQRPSRGRKHGRNESEDDKQDRRKERKADDAIEDLARKFGELKAHGAIKSDTQDLLNLLTSLASNLQERSSKDQNRQPDAPAPQAIQIPPPQPQYIYQQPHQSQQFAHPQDQYPARDQPPHLTEPNSIPLGRVPYQARPRYNNPTPVCYFCNGVNHTLWICPTLADYQRRGILTRDPTTGRLLYKNQPVPVPLSQLKIYVDNQEGQNTAVGAGNARTQAAPAVHSVSINWQPPDVSESGHNFYEASIYQVGEDDRQPEEKFYEVDAGKRTRAGGSDSDHVPIPRKVQVIPDERDRVRNLGPQLQDQRGPIERLPFSIKPTPTQRRREHQPTPGPSHVPQPREETRFVEPPAIPKESMPVKEPKGKGRAQDDDVSMKEGTIKTRGPPTHRMGTNFDAKYNSREVYQTMLDQEISLSIGQLLAVSYPLTQHLVEDGRRKRMPVAVNSADLDLALDSDVNLHGISPNIPYIGPLGFGKCTVYGYSNSDARVVKALLDSGSQINIISDELRRKVGLGLRTDGVHKMRGAGGTAVPMLGLCEYVGIHVSGLDLEVHFYCMKDANFHVLLGVPFLHLVGAAMQFRKDGSVEMGMTHEGKTAILEISAPGDNEYLFNVPGQAKSTIEANTISQISGRTDDYGSGDESDKDDYGTSEPKKEREI